MIFNGQHAKKNGHSSVSFTILEFAPTFDGTYPATLVSFRSTAYIQIVGFSEGERGPEKIRPISQS